MRRQKLGECAHCGQRRRLKYRALCGSCYLRLNHTYGPKRARRDKPVDRYGGIKAAERIPARYRQAYEQRMRLLEERAAQELPLLDRRAGSMFENTRTS